METTPNAILEVQLDNQCVCKFKDTLIGVGCGAHNAMKSNQIKIQTIARL